MKPTLLVLAAGLGSRYGGVKQIDSVGEHGETLLDFATYDAKQCGFERVVYIIRKDIEKDFRARLFDRIAKNFNAEYVFQNPDSLFTSEQLAKISPTRKKPWGTIHAVLCAENAVHTPFAVINADDYYGREALGLERFGRKLNRTRNGRLRTRKHDEPLRYGFARYLCCRKRILEFNERKHKNRLSGEHHR